MKIELELNIKPTSLKRARHTVRGRYATSYYTHKDKQEMDELKYTILNALTTQHKQDIKNLLKDTKNDYYISLTLHYEFDMPKSWSKKKKLLKLGTPHTSKPDLDNLIKNILDRGNNILWEDDKNISYITASKKWSNQDKITITVEYERVG